MNKRIPKVAHGFMIFVFLMISFPNPSRSEPPDEIVNAAKQGLRLFAQKLSSPNLNQIGPLANTLASDEDLGQAFQIYTIHPSDVISFDDNSSDAEPIISPTNLWLFLLKGHWKPPVVLSVDLLNGNWTAVGIGSAGLASQLDKILVAWPKSGGYFYKLIRIYQATSDFIEISKEGSVIGVIPLTSARVMMGLSDRTLNPLGLYNLKDLINNLKPIVRDNVQNWR